MHKYLKDFLQRTFDAEGNYNIQYIIPKNKEELKKVFDKNKNILIAGHTITTIIANIIKPIILIINCYTNFNFLNFSFLNILLISVKSSNKCS